MTYIVTFDTEHRSERCTRHYVYHCEAKNAKEAVQIARDNWPTVFGDNPRIPHQFHCHAVRSRFADPDMCRIVTWRGAVVNGQKCFDFYCTGITNWPR